MDKKIPATEYKPQTALDNRLFVVLGIQSESINTQLDEMGATRVFEGEIEEYVFDTADSCVGMHIVSTSSEAKIISDSQELQVGVEDKHLAVQGLLAQAARLTVDRQHRRIVHKLSLGQLETEVSTVTWPGAEPFAEIAVDTLGQAQAVARRIGLNPDDVKELTLAKIFEAYSVTSDFARFDRQEKVEISYHDVQRLVRQVVQARAKHLTFEEVDIIADHYLRAEMAGKITHGLRKMCWDVRMYGQRQGEPYIERERPAIAVIDGNKEIGPLVAQMGVNEVIRRAKATGMAAITIKEMQRFGMLATWTEQIAKAGLIGILTVSTEEFVAPPGAREGRLGTNPISIAVPYGDTAIVYDASLSKQPMNRVWTNRLTGEKLPKGFLDAYGNAVDDPYRARFVEVFGGAKGFGLSFMMQILSGPLQGVASHSTFKNPYNNGLYMQAIDPTAFTSREEFDKRIADLIESVKTAPLHEECGEIRLPGEQSRRNIEQVLRAGKMQVHANTLEQLHFLRGSVTY